MTNNRDDFVDLVAKADLHAGLIVIVPNVRREIQIKLFRAALERVKTITSMINRVLEVEEGCAVRVYDLPPRQ